MVAIDGQQYLMGSDTIVSINGTRIVNCDAFFTYLEGIHCRVRQLKSA